MTSCLARPCSLQASLAHVKKRTRIIYSLHAFSSPYVIANPSVCRPSVRWCTPRTRRGLNFLAIFCTVYNRLGTQTVCIKILEKKIQRYSRWSSKLNRRGMKNRRFSISTNISLYFEKDTRYGFSYNERRIRTRMRFIEWCHFQGPWTTPNLRFIHLFNDFTIHIKQT